MRAKNREINIFNMSLLDILTGALGAFMFLMLSFVPYYNIVMENRLTPSENQEEKEKLKERADDLERQRAELQEKVDELIEELKRAGQGDVSKEELARLEEENNRLRKEIETLRSEIDRLQAEKAALQEKVTALTRKADELQQKVDELQRKVEELRQKLETMLKENDRLRAENEELKRKLASLRPGDPQAEEELRKLRVEAMMKHRRILVGAIIDGDEPFEFLMRDPKGFWYDTQSFFPIGRKAVRLTSLTGAEAFDPSDPEQQQRAATPSGNILLLSAEGFFRRGEYLLAARHRGSRPAEVRPSGQGPSQTDPTQTDPTQTGLLFHLPGLIIRDAVAQTSRQDFGFGHPGTKARPATVAYPQGVSRKFITAIAEMQFFEFRPSINPMNGQTLPVANWISVLGKITVQGPMIKFQWFNRLAEDGSVMDTAGIPSFADAEERQRLEEEVNSKPIEPLRQRRSCMGPSLDCRGEVDLRGELKQGDIDPALRDIIHVGEPTDSGAKGSAADAVRGGSESSAPQQNGGTTK